jgi:hypothetical protein
MTCRIVVLLPRTKPRRKVEVQTPREQWRAIWLARLNPARYSVHYLMNEGNKIVSEMLKSNIARLNHAPGE